MPQLSRENRIACEGEHGQTMTEYAVTLGLITLAIVLTLGSLSTAIEGLVTKVVGIFP